MDAPTPAGQPNAVSLLDADISAAIGTLQALDDAIAFRIGRLNVPCAACGDPQKCTEHAQDERLIQTYQHRYGAALQEAFSGMDPGAIEQVMGPGDHVPPTVAMLAIAVATRLRELTADGPALVTLDAGPVLIEPEGHTFIEHPLSD